MFFFGRKALQSDARNIAEWVLRFRNDLFGSDDLTSFLSKLRSYPIEKSYTDHRKKACGWFIKEDKRFSFHVDFAFTVNSPHCLTVESHEEYFGVIFTSSSRSSDVNVTLNDSGAIKLGPKAADFHSALLSFPEFSDVTGMFKNMLGR